MGVWSQPTVSPWVQEFVERDDLLLRITVDFNTTTGAITGITTYRHPDCIITKIYIGVGADGTPNSTDKVIDVPAGTTVLSQQRLNQLANRGLATIKNIAYDLNFTAGP